MGINQVIMNGRNHNCNMNGDRKLFKNVFMRNNIKLGMPQVRILMGILFFLLLLCCEASSSKLHFKAHLKHDDE